MADLFGSISNIVLPPLGRESGVDGGVRSWLLKGTYQVAHTGSFDSLLLENVSGEEVIRYIASDYERFALSSRGSFSVADLEANSKNLLGWPLLKLYYAGFFAAHALMRSAGEGIVKLERDQAATLNAVIGIQAGIIPGVKAGMYRYKLLQQKAGRLSVSLNVHAENGGVHESFWKAFIEFLEVSAAEAVTRKLPDAALFVAGVSELSPAMKIAAQKKSVWYSSIRNEINYQHKYGVWFPTEKARSKIDLIESVGGVSSSSIRLDASLTKSPIEAFVGVSHYLSCLNFEVAEYVAARSLLARSFGAKWRRLNELLA